MQSWLPAQGSGMVVLRALPIVAAMLHAQVALGFEGLLSLVPLEPTSTLDGHVTPQDLELQERVIDFVGSGVLSDRKRPRLQAPKLRAPKLRAPKLSAPKNPQAPKQTNPTAKAPAVEATKKVSPFRKWVKPQFSPTEKLVQKPVQKTEEKKAAPKIARATKRPLPLKLAQPAPLRLKARIPAKTRHTTAAPAPAKKSVESRPSRHPSPNSSPSLTATPTTAPARNLPSLTTSQLNLRKKIRSVLTHYYNRPLNTRDRSPWELMHAMLAFEAHSKVLQGGPKGKPITAVGWLCYNQACKRRTLMYVNDEGELRVRVGPALQGHRGQLLAMLAQSRINENYPMLVEEHELKVADLIEMEKRTCYPRTELTFKLIALMHYLDSDATWMNDQGMEWNIPRLISEELRQPVRGAACGGTHRLAGLTLAYKTREKRGEPLDGQYLKAKKFVTRYQQYAYRLQNRDGSFSTEWFRGPGNEESLDRKLKTTGHLLEWLLYAASEKELHHRKTTKAVNYLANIMSRNRYKDWEAGPLGHAIHALLVYDRLTFVPYDRPEQGPIAGHSKPVARRR